MQAIILTYDGWYEALYFTEEIKDPVRQIAALHDRRRGDCDRDLHAGERRRWFTCCRCANWWRRNCPRPMRRLDCSGHRSVRLITVLSLISLPPMISAVMLCAPRILYAMSRGGLFPARMSDSEQARKSGLGAGCDGGARRCAGVERNVQDTDRDGKRDFRGEPRVSR